MATLEAWKLANGNVQWVIWDLQNPFNTEHYISAGIADEEVTFGAAAIDGILSETMATFDYEDYWAPGVWIDPPLGRHVLYGFAQSSNGLYYPAGTFTLMLGSPDEIGLNGDWVHGIWMIGYNGTWHEAERMIGQGGEWV